MPPSAFELAEEARAEAESRAEVAAQARAEAQVRARLVARGLIVLLPNCSRGHLKEWSETQGRWLCLACRNIKKRERRGWAPRPVVAHVGDSVPVRRWR